MCVCTKCPKNSNYLDGKKHVRCRFNVYEECYDRLCPRGLRAPVSEKQPYFLIGIVQKSSQRNFSFNFGFITHLRDLLKSRNFLTWCLQWNCFSIQMFASYRISESECWNTNIAPHRPPHMPNFYTKRSIFSA